MRDVQEAHTDYDAIRQRARKAAAELLNSGWRGELPIDPVVVARSLGISVFNSQLGEDMWGMIVADEQGTDIYLDKDQPLNRWRFSCAHEIGHFVEHASAGDEMSYVDRRSDDTRGDPHEVYANEFAASLLMPEKVFRDLWKLGQREISLTKTFGVSLQAVRWRLKHLGIAE